MPAINSKNLLHAIRPFGDTITSPKGPAPQSTNLTTLLQEFGWRIVTSRLGIIETILAAAFVFFDLVILDTEPRPIDSLVACSCVLLVAYSPRFPRFTAFLGISAAAWASSLDIAIMAMTSFLPLLLVHIYAAQGHVLLAIISSCCLGLFLTADPFSGSFFPDQITTVTYAFFYLFAYSNGRARAHTIQRRQIQHQEWENKLRTQRMEIARDLHDSLAQSLTTIVMRAESLNLLPPDDPRVPSELRFISHKARNSVQELRTMLRILYTDQDVEQGSSPEDIPTLIEICASIEKLLAESGFDIRFTGNYLKHAALKEGSYLNAETLRMAHKILLEACTNIIKYGSHSEPVTAQINAFDNGISIGLLNRINPSPKQKYLSSGLGMDSMISRAATVGGAVTAHRKGQYWEFRLLLPLES